MALVHEPSLSIMPLSVSVSVGLCFDAGRPLPDELCYPRNLYPFFAIDLGTVGWVDCHIPGGVTGFDGWKTVRCEVLLLDGP